MLKGVFTFGLGVYTGIYLAQNYELPPANNPKKAWEDFKEFADKFKKK